MKSSYGTDGFEADPSTILSYVWAPRGQAPGRQHRLLGQEVIGKSSDWRLIQEQFLCVTNVLAEIQFKL